MDAVASVTIRRSYSTLITAMFVFECPFEREQTGAFPVFKYLWLLAVRKRLSRIVALTHAGRRPRANQGRNRLLADESRVTLSLLGSYH